MLQDNTNQIQVVINPQTTETLLLIFGEDCTEHRVQPPPHIHIYTFYFIYEIKRYDKLFCWQDKNKQSQWSMPEFQLLCFRLF